MADYYPLLARALDGLTDSSHEAREAVYDRARTALRSQLGSIVPALGESEINRECASLDEAIARIERQRAMDNRLGSADDAPEDLRDDIAVGPTHDDAPGQTGQPAIRRGGRRNRSLLTAGGLVVAITPIAVAAWLWRDQPAPTPTPEPTRASTPQPSANDPKFPERMTGQGSGAPVPASPRPAPPTASAPPPTAPPAAPPPSQPQPAPVAGAPPPAGSPAADPAPVAGAPTATQQPEIAVAQRAALIEENTADPQQPKVTPGRALWRLDAVNTGQGQLLETVVRATIDVPDSKISLSLLLRRNRDAALPASHTLELTFTTATSGEDARVVRDVNPPLVRPDDSSRGVPLAALSVPVKENVFLIGLSNLKSDIDRNTDLLVNRNWIELPVRFGSGARATLVFEKGVSGDRVVGEAFKQWAQQ